MRKHFSNYIESVAHQDDLVFITGDLGYNALENLREKMGARFVNAGVAEQNMISVASGMASQGYRVVCYSIAPFIVYRCLEQMRNDVCFHDLPVYIAGNGGGYHYGALGSSHHALEDIAALSGLPNICCYVPAFVEDMNACMEEMLARRHPAYLRLGVGKAMPPSFTLCHWGSYSLAQNPRLSLVVQSPVINNVIAAVQQLGCNHDVDILVVNRMPFGQLSDTIANSISRTARVLVVEEHIVVGGLAQSIALGISKSGIGIHKFLNLNAMGYPNGLYGNQAYHQQISELDVPGIAKHITQLLEIQ